MCEKQYCISVYIYLFSGVLEKAHTIKFHEQKLAYCRPSGANSKLPRVGL